MNRRRALRTLLGIPAALVVAPPIVAELLESTPAIAAPAAIEPSFAGPAIASAHSMLLMNASQMARYIEFCYGPARRRLPFRNRRLVNLIDDLLADDTHAAATYGTLQRTLQRVDKVATNSRK